MRAISQAAFLIGGIQIVKIHRKRNHTGKAPTGRSTGSQPCERASGTNTPAYPRGCYFRESYSTSTGDVIRTVGELSMQSNQIIIINGTLRVIGAFLLLSRRAHLLTTAKTCKVWTAVVFQHLLKPCALRGLRLRRSLAEAAAEPPTSVRLPVRQPHCQRCTTALTAWVSLRRHPVLLNRFRNTF